MSFLSQFTPSEFVSALGWTLLHSLWQGSIIALLLACLLVVLHRHSSTVRYVVAAICMGTMLVTSVATFMSIYSAGPAPEKPGKAERLFATGFPVEFLTPSQEALASTQPSPETSLSFVNYFDKHLPLVVLVWLVGITVLLLRMIGGLAYTQRLKHYRVNRLPESWQQKLSHLASKIGIDKPLQLVESAMVKVPMVIGYVKPVILLPIGTVTGLPSEQIEAILAHELAHIYRKDYLINIAQSFIEILFFYHPAMWWISNTMREEREHCCDDLALSVCGDSFTFAKALANLEEKQYARPAQLAMAFTGQNGSLLNRIKRMINQPKRMPTFGEGFIAASVLLVGILLISVSANAHFGMDKKGMASKESGIAAVSTQALPKRKVEPIVKAPIAEDYQAVVLQVKDSTDKNTDLIIVKNKKGKIVELYVDGKKIPSNKIEEYRPMINEALQAQKKTTYSANVEKDMAKAEKALKEVWKNNAEDMDISVHVDVATDGFAFAPIPPMPPLASLPPMPDIAPFPVIINEKEIEAYTDAMQGFEVEMKAFEKDMQNFGKDMARFEEEMQKLSVEMDHEMEGKIFKNDQEREKEFAALEKRREALHKQREQRLAQVEELRKAREKAHSNREKLSREMEQNRMEQANVRKEIREEREKAFKEREKIREKTMEERAIAMEKRKEKMEKHEAFMKKLKTQLLRDKLINNEKEFEFKMSGSELYIDGKKQPEEVFKKYKALFEKQSGQPFTGQFHISIQED